MLNWVINFTDLLNPSLISVGQVLEIPDIDGSDDSNPLADFHRAFNNGVRWRLTTDGVEIEGSGIERTSASPTIATKICPNFNSNINEWSQQFNVLAVLIIATIVTESSGKVDAIRKEPGYIDDIRRRRH